MSGESLDRRFRWLWASYAVSVYGTGFGFGALPLIAIGVLHVGPAQVSALAATGVAVGALIAVPLGPWVEFRRKRPVMMAMDLSRFVMLASIPAAYAFGALSYVHLLVTAVVAAAADITFRAASGAYLKTIVRPEDLLTANARFESTMWSAQTIAPPLGGAAMGLVGPVVTVAADAVSYLLSALGIRAIGGADPHPVITRDSVTRTGALLEGWRFILAHRGLRAMLLNSALFSGLILATEPVLAVLLVGDLGFAPWQYGLAFAVPCLGGLVGARLSRPLATRFGGHRVMLAGGTARACWPIGLTFVGHGTAGLVAVIVIEFGLILCIGISNPLIATYRLARTTADRAARTLSAWTITSRTTTAALTALWGILAATTSPRTALAAAGVLLLATPLLLPRHDHPIPADPEPVAELGPSASR
ncbi:MFS transporter [Nocardia arizonensis]|uniref:MFS transporter n=1 Tax=Nocardia arizonensis TaxID=1141647 RepID=UPI0006CFB7F7|nr:MFS transporter [Nocardia arizonensis]